MFIRRRFFDRVIFFRIEGIEVCFSFFFSGIWRFGDVLFFGFFFRWTGFFVCRDRFRGFFVRGFWVAGYRVLSRLFGVGDRLDFVGRDLVLRLG